MYKAVCKYFGEKDTTDYQDFMANLQFLCSMFEKARQDNERKRQAILEAAKAAERKRLAVC
jgi:hypothetical protein